MGFNTTLFILNDQFGEIERNPASFVQSILENWNSGGDLRTERVTSLMGTTEIITRPHVGKVMRTAHADEPRLYFTHQNLITELSSIYSPGVMNALEDPRRRAFLKKDVEYAKRMLASLERDIARRDLAAGTAEFNRNA